MAQQDFAVRQGYTQRTGNAPIIRQGHTTDGTQGSDPNASAIPERTVRDLKPTS